MSFDEETQAWRYDSDGANVADEPDRMCGRCNSPNREDDHDACLGELPGVMNACCGHGETAEAYVQYPDGSSVRGLIALAAILEMNVNR